METEQKILFCHYYFSKGECKNNSCEFSHKEKSLGYRGNQYLQQRICPNGIRCPMNHRKIDCPIEQKHENCDRLTRIGRKAFKCEYRHKKKHQEKQDKQQKIQEKIVEEEKVDFEKKQKILQEGTEIEIEETKKELQQRQKDLENSEKQNFNFYRLPKAQKNEQSTIIGVIDQSGSMYYSYDQLSSNWNRLVDKYGKDNIRTVIYQDRAKELVDRYLVNHPSGCDDIEDGFKLCTQILEEQSTADNVTIVYIADGGDRDTYTICDRMERFRHKLQQIHKKKTINFLCVGIGLGFPTLMAMKIRDIYHNGEESVPPMFLVDGDFGDYKMSEFNQQFQNMEQYIFHNEQIKLQTTPVQTLPWQEPTQNVYENQIVFTEEQTQEITLEDGTKIQAIEKLEQKEITEIGRVFLNDLQLRSINKKTTTNIIKKQANQAYQIVLKLHDAQQKREEEQKMEEVKLTFRQKVEQKYKPNLQKINSILAQLKQLSQNNLLDGLSDSEAAKRLAIGTKVGKYHEKAMEKAGLSVEDFKKARDDFVKDLKTQIQEKKLVEGSGSQPASFMSLQNQKDVFFEEGFVEGLELIENQYDLVELFPLVGQSLYIRRTDGSMINPYLVSVQDIIRNHNVIDTISITSQPENTIKVSIGDQQNETINAVLPLFGDEDQDLQFFLQSKLFSILMTFNVCQNADTCLDQSYLALLSNSLINLMNQKKSDWREQMITSVLKTIKIAYGPNKTFKIFQNVMCKEPGLTVITKPGKKAQKKIQEILEKSDYIEESEFEKKQRLQLQQEYGYRSRYMEIQQKNKDSDSIECPDLAKTIAHLTYQLEYNFTESQKEERIQLVDKVFEQILKEAMGRFIKRDQPFHESFEFENPEEVQNSINVADLVDQIIFKFYEPELAQNFYTQFELIKAIRKEIKNLKIENPEQKIVFSKKFQQQGKLNTLSLKKIYTVLTQGKFLDEQKIIQMAYFAHSINDSNERYLQYNNIYAKKKIMEILTLSKFNHYKLKKLQEVEKTVIEKMIPLYEKQIKQIHKISQPLTQKEIQEIEGIKINKKSASSLPTNVCIYKNCPHYKKVNSSLSQHLLPLVKIPTLHKACLATAENQDLSDEQVLEQILHGDFMKEKTEQKADAMQELIENREFYIERIAEIRKFYRENKFE